MNNTKTFKHIFTFEEHDYLMETSIDFIPMVGLHNPTVTTYLPLFLSCKIREVDLREEIEEDR